MNRQALRSAWSWVRPEVEQICQPHRTYFRQFSTTSSQLDDSNSNNPTPSSTPGSQQRSRAASSQGASSSSNRGQSGQQPPRVGGGSRFTNPPKPGDGPVLDIRNTNINFRGRGGGSASGQRGSMRGRGGFRGSGRRPAPSQGDRGRGRRRGGVQSSSRRDQQDPNAVLLPPAPKSRELSQADQEEKLEAVAEEAFQKSMTMGERTVFEPNVSLEDLQKHMPHFAGGVAGRRATVINNLAQLGTQDPVNAPQELQPRDYAKQLERDGLQFFADLREREYTEKYLADQEQYDAEVYEAHKWLTSDDAEPNEVADASEAKADDAAAAGTEGSAEPKTSILGDVEDSIKKVILEKAVMGVYEKPLPGTDAVTRARAAHVRSESYTTANANAFAAKVQSLLARRTVAQKPAPKEESKAKEKKGPKKGQKAANA